MDDSSDIGRNNGDQRLPEYIENVGKDRPQPDVADATSEERGPTGVLSDEELLIGGLAPIKSWVRTQKSAGARRTQKNREEQAEQGIKQVNVIAPESAHDVIKKIAEKARAGVQLIEVLKEIVGDLSQNQPEPMAPASKQADAQRPELKENGYRLQNEEPPKIPGKENVSDDLQKCTRRRDELEQELLNLRTQLSVVQALPKLTGWRRVLVCRIAGIKMPF